MSLLINVLIRESKESVILQIYREIRLKSLPDQITNLLHKFKKALLRVTQARKSVLVPCSTHNVEALKLYKNCFKDMQAIRKRPIIV